MTDENEVHEGEPEIVLFQSQLTPMIRDQAEKLAPELAKEKIVLIESEKRALESQLRESRLEVRAAHNVNENLQATIDELKLGGEEDDSMMVEQRTALDVAGKHRKRLEAENGELTSTISDMAATENCLHNEIRDLEYQINREKVAQ